MLNWGMVRELSNNKVITTTSIWVFLVPIIFKTMTFEVLETSLVPRTFVVLYFSGVAFFLGSVIYVIFASQLIKKYNSYSSFSEHGGDVYLLQSYLKSMNDIDSQLILKEFKNYIGDATAKEIDSGVVSYIEVGTSKSVFIFKTEHLKDIFWILYIYFLNKGRFFIFLSLFFHIVGFLALSYLFVNNFALIVMTLLLE